ncbi:2Fe-2S iron-sulfur cluster-binding protein [Pseudonocardia acidicola]|uniref:2Fe-2S iron-sulfur cluster binding domain-containing protein n=1 Tax=Pseudonocardia acidicola TaxID=2724939 RepID=A0ABX1S6W7_9PSEU|nr:2Fe-2S iron-sulfur cluster-binding protein [Pseudonocardia acidicola]NMH96855.1 2Fe-2S iron-sulfur cluster binding domain-containing protein [Pseudonocardia acidicola]
MDLKPSVPDDDSIDVTIHPSAVTIGLRPGEALLDGLRRHGYSHRHGCRRGGCGQCKVDVLTGEVGYDVVVADTVLTGEERATGTALSCRALARSGPITVALRNETLRCFFPWVTGADPATTPGSA